MVALLQTKIQNKNKMTTKNKLSENDFNATIGNTVLAEVHPIEGLLHLVVKNNGNIQMPKTVFPNSWKINYIRGVNLLIAVLVSVITLPFGVRTELANAGKTIRTIS